MERDRSVAVLAAQQGNDLDTGQNFPARRGVGELSGGSLGGAPSSPAPAPHDDDDDATGECPAANASPDAAEPADECFPSDDSSRSCSSPAPACCLAEAEAEEEEEGEEEWPVPLGPVDLLKQVLCSCGPDDYALLGPVACPDIYRLCDLLEGGGVGLRWLYVAVQDPYRHGEFSGLASRAVCRIAAALATNRELKGLVLRLPELELSDRQVKKIIVAFAKALRMNHTLTSLRFKPAGYFARKGADMTPLFEAAKISDAQRMAILEGTHARTGRYSCIRSLPKEILQRVMDSCDCKVSNG